MRFAPPVDRVELSNDRSSSSSTSHATIDPWHSTVVYAGLLRCIDKGVAQISVVIALLTAQHRRPVKTVSHMTVLAGT